MRLVFVFLAAVLAFAAPSAWAQDKDAVAATAAPSADSFTPSHLAAARDTLQAILVDTGALSAGSLQAFTLLMPQFRNQITTTELYAALPSDRQRALVAYIEAMPPIAQEETLRGAPQLFERYAPRMAALFSEGELAGIAAFLRTPEGSAFFQRSVTDGVQSEASGRDVPTMATNAELAALDAFNRTPAGMAFNARATEMGVLMREVGATASGAPNITARLQGDMCAIVGEHCPSGWRRN